MKIPKELYSDMDKLRKHCVCEVSKYIGLLLVIDGIDDFFKGKQKG